MTRPTSPQDAPGRQTFSHATIVRSALRWEADGARSIGDLAESLQLTRRQVEDALQDLVSGGSYPIVAGSRGVYLTHDPAELDAYGDALLRRARSQYRRVKGVRRCARAMRQPATLFPELAA